MSKKSDTHAQENNTHEGKGAVSLTDTAVQHYLAVLDDPDASDSAKANAASGLAHIDRTRQKAAQGTIHRLSRSELTQEIARVQAQLASMA